MREFIKHIESFSLAGTLFSLLLLGVPLAVCAQPRMENELKILQAELKKNESALLELTEELQSKAEYINQRKADPANDKAEIKRLLASTANLTNKIEFLQIERDSLTKKYDILKAGLFQIYSNRIDSLKKSSLSDEKKGVLITALIEKRLYVSPKIDMLSFEPEKVLRIKPSSNSADKKIHREFLTSAKSEVETKLKEIVELKSEISAIISLNEESKSFLEEAEFDSDLSYFNANAEVSASERTASMDHGGSYGQFENSLKTQTNTFAEILSQLDYNRISDERSYSLNNIILNNDLKEFTNLIDNVEQQLLDYKTIISKKLQIQ